MSKQKDISKDISLEALRLAAKALLPVKGIFINANAEPNLPKLDESYSGYTPYQKIISHEQQGIFDFRFEDVKFIKLNQRLRTEEDIKSLIDVIKKDNLIPLNINFLARLMEKHRKEIPQSWDEFYIMFPGTIYLNERSEAVCIPTMYCCASQWTTQKWWLWQLFSYEATIYSHNTSRGHIICLPGSSRLV